MINKHPEASGHLFPVLQQTGSAAGNDSAARCSIPVSEMLSDLFVCRLVVQHVGCQRNTGHALFPIAIALILNAALPFHADEDFIIHIQPGPI